MLNRLRIIAAAVLPLSFLFGGPLVAADDSEAWRAFAEGRAVLIMRHALAPGFSDPDDFDIDDCRTQRNLSEAGRVQATAIGQEIANRIGTDVSVDVLSSAWCRCVETGESLGLGAVEVLPALNSFFRNRDRADNQTEALRAWIRARLSEQNRPAILVTHQVNITAATGVFPNSGEAVMVDAEGEVLLQSLLAEPSVW